jgi:hypothetical protein
LLEQGKLGQREALATISDYFFTGKEKLYLGIERGHYHEYITIGYVVRGLKQKCQHITASSEINFVGISIEIPIEINFDFRRNYWSQLSKVNGISISTVEIKIPINNQKRIFDLFR